MTEATTNALTLELAQLNTELAALNERRKSIYLRSLEADDDEKAAVDTISNAMLSGPLAPENTINWPIELHGIYWKDDDSPTFEVQSDQGWAVVRPHGDPCEHLGVHVGNITTAVAGRLTDGMLHLSYETRAPLLYVPFLGKFLTAAQVNWRMVSGLTDLERFAPDDGVDNPWYDRAHLDVTGYAQAAALAELDEREGGGDDGGSQFTH